MWADFVPALLENRSRNTTAPRARVWSGEPSTRCAGRGRRACRHGCDDDLDAAGGVGVGAAAGAHTATGGLQGRAHEASLAQAHAASRSARSRHGPTRAAGLDRLGRPAVVLFGLVYSVERALSSSTDVRPRRGPFEVHIPMQAPGSEAGPVSRAAPGGGAVVPRGSAAAWTATLDSHAALPTCCWRPRRGLVRRSAARGGSAVEGFETLKFFPPPRSRPRTRSDLQLDADADRRSARRLHGSPRSRPTDVLFRAAAGKFAKSNFSLMVRFRLRSSPVRRDLAFGRRFASIAPAPPGGCGTRAKRTPRIRPARRLASGDAVSALAAPSEPRREARSPSRCACSLPAGRGRSSAASTCGS